MKKTFISLLVLFSICSLFLTLVPAVHSQTATDNIKIVSYSWYIDSLGFLVVVGEVQNVGSSTVGSVILAGAASSSDGGQVQSSTQAYVVDLIPNQKAPFYWEFYDQSNQNGGYWVHPDVSNIDIFVYQAETTTSYLYPDVIVTSHQSSIGTNKGTGPNDQTADYGAYWVTGQIKNTGSQTATNIRVIGTFYNSSGAVVAVGGYITEIVSTSLAPSASASFKFGAFDLNQTDVASEKKITDYSLLVQVESPILQGTAPSINPTEAPGQGTTNPTANAGSPGSNPLDALSPNSIYAIVVVVVVIAIVAAFLILRKRSKPKPKPVIHTTKKTKKNKK